MEAPEVFINSYYGATPGAAEFLADKRVSDQKPGDLFMVDDLLDFSKDDNDAMATDGFFENSSNFNSNDSCNSFGSTAGSNVRYQSFSTDSHQFSSELCVPCDDLAELEWLSNFVEDSFSNEQNLQTNLHFLCGSKPGTPASSSSKTHPETITRNPNNPIFQTESPLPGKARSKRSRVGPGDWSTRLLHISPITKLVSKEHRSPNPKPRLDTTIRKCLHCAAEQTPQWRTGPMGPKTLCNACGVRYKSGRLVPEYRPAASPTFVSTKHSNSHRKVLELRRMKDLQRQQQGQFLSQCSIFGVSNGGDDFLIHHHGGPNYRQML